MAGDERGRRLVRRTRRMSAPFGVVVGIVVGVMLSALLMPDHAGGRVVAGAAPASQGGPAVGAQSDTTPTIAGQAASADPNGGGGAASPSADSLGSTVTTAVASATAAASAAAPGTKVRGVTDNKIRIGVAVVDDTSFKALGDRFTVGDIQGYWESIKRAWHNEGLLPVNGRDIEFVYRKFDPIIGASQQRAACVGFIQDDQVFMVVGTTSFGIGIQCVTAEFKTPLLMVEWVTDEVYAQGAPYAFNIPTSESRIFRDFPHWAASKGLLTGKKIGLYYWNDPDLVGQVNKYLKPAFAQVGANVVVDMQSDGQYGGPNDNVAVQRFRTSGVDVAIILGILKTNFTQTAQAQGYKPQYLDFDYNYGGDDTTQSNNEPNNYDGALASAGWRWGERGSNVQRDALQMKCKNDYKAYSGIDNGRDDYQTAAEAVLWQSCDVARLLIVGLQQAGRDLTADSVVHGLETIKNQPMAYFGNVTFAPGKHSGVDQQRTLKYQAACKCFKIVSDWYPISVP
jgi:hypothetical protein